MLKALIETVHLKRDPVGYARSKGVTVGDDCRFLGTRRGTFGSEPYLVTIGNHVTITSDVNFVTHEGGVWVLRQDYPQIDVFAPIVVEDNCFIGLGATLLPGVTIGANSIVGASALVTHDVPAGSVVGGTPAKIITTTAEFRERILPNSMHIRDLPPSAKRKAIETHLGIRR